MKCIKFYKQNLETKELEFRDNKLQKYFVQNFFLLFATYQNVLVISRQFVTELREIVLDAHEE